VFTWVDDMVSWSARLVRRGAAPDQASATSGGLPSA